MLGEVKIEYNNQISTYARVTVGGIPVRCTGYNINHQVGCIPEIELSLHGVGDIQGIMNVAIPDDEILFIARNMTYGQKDILLDEFEKSHHVSK